MSVFWGHSVVGGVTVCGNVDETRHKFEVLFFVTAALPLSERFSFVLNTLLSDIAFKDSNVMPQVIHGCSLLFRFSFVRNPLCSQSLTMLAGH